MKKFLILLLLLSLLLSCEDIPQDETDANNFDEQLVQIVRQMPGFGGMYLNENGDLKVYLKEKIQQWDESTRAARRERLKVIFTSIFGKKLLTRKTKSGELSRKIQFIKGAFDIEQLFKWRKIADQTLNIPGVVFTDLDEKSNRVRIGITDDSVVEKIKNYLTNHNIPDDAVIFEKTKPIELTTTLRDKFRPMPGGVQIGKSGDVVFTLGFNAITSNNMFGFVTCSHGMNVRGGSLDTNIYQPNIKNSGQIAIGRERIDPDFFTGGNCPSGRRCRWSDAAFVQYINGTARGSNIARTLGVGSLTINNSNSKFKITSERNPTRLPGSRIQKIGRTTGWTEGTLRNTCINSNVSNSNITLLCQVLVDRAGSSARLFAPGDSGSPAFARIEGTNDVILVGIFWGSASDGSNATFSPINMIERELGSLKTFDF